MSHPWQHYRDKTAQMENTEVLRHLYSLIGLDLTAFALSRLGVTSSDLANELLNEAQSRKLARDLLATALYIGQSEKRHVPRSWLICMHPGFDYEFPADLFRNGRADEVISHLQNDGRLFFSLSA